MKLALIGHPVNHSLSPPMHRAAFLYFGIEGSYELLDLTENELDSFFNQFADSGMSGFNVTLPYKESVFRLSKYTSPEATLLQAVNTVRLDSSGCVHAHNTDLSGFVTALQQELNGRIYENALLLGAGGSARACLAGLFICGSKKVFVAARRLEEIKNGFLDLAESISCHLERECVVELISFDALDEFKMPSLLVNCTPVGLSDSDKLPLWASSLFSQMKGEGLFFDIVYRRDLKPTLLLSLARKRGLSCQNGLSMLAAQAALAFQFWTGRLPPLNVMLQAARVESAESEFPE